MKIEENPVKTGENYLRTELGPLADLDQYVITMPRGNREVRGKVFLGDLLGLNSMEVSVNKMAVGGGMPFLHSHRKNEELYYFLGGKGEFQVDGEIFPVREGTVIRVKPDGLRALRNTGDEALTFIVIQAQEQTLEAKNSGDGLVPDAPVVWS